LRVAVALPYFKEVLISYATEGLR